MCGAVNEYLLISSEGEEIIDKGIRGGKLKEQQQQKKE